MNNLTITKSKFIFFSFSFLGLIAAICSSYVLPKKYFSDALTIIHNPWNLKGVVGGFQLSIFFYSITGMRWMPFSLVALIQYPILIYILTKIGIPSNFDKVKVNNLLMYASFFVIGIFISMQTKEFITFIFCAILVKLIKNKNKEYVFRNRIIICLMILLYSYIFREYYYLVLILSIFISILSYCNLKLNSFLIVIYGLIMIILMSCGHNMVKHGYLSDKTRTELNERRLDDPKIKEESRSAIIPPLPTNTWYGDAVSIIYGFMVVNIPITSIFSASPQVSLFSIWQLTLFFCLSLKFDQILKIKKNNNIRWAYYITFSFFIVQGLFEPDLGSSIRHKAGIFPLIYFILFYDDKEK